MARHASARSEGLAQCHDDSVPRVVAHGAREVDRARHSHGKSGVGPLHRRHQIAAFDGGGGAGDSLG